MSNDPAVSIFIVTYVNSEERAEILRRTCRQVLKQRYSNFEVVVSDNAGPISAADALSSIEDSRLRVVRNEENAGFTGNMNRCIELCLHDIIKPLCDDDLIHYDFLSATVPLVADDAMVLADVGKYEVGSEPEGIGDAIACPPQSEIRPAGYGMDMWRLSYSNSCIPSAVLFTRQLFSDLGGYDDSTLLSDWDFYAEVCLHRKIIHVKQTLSYIGEWEETVTSTHLRDDPFSFAREGLYTSFRVLKCGGLTAVEQRKLLLRKWWWLTKDTMCLMKHMVSRRYRSSFSAYRKRFFELLKSDETTFKR